MNGFQRNLYWGICEGPRIGRRKNRVQFCDNTKLPGRSDRPTLHLISKETLPLRHFRTVSLATVILAAILLPGVEAEAQDKGISIGIFGGLGGSPDSDGYDGSGFQLLAAMDLSRNTLTGVRIGEMSTEFELDNGAIEENDMSYITVGTEYRRDADYYTSGLLIGLGYYRLEGPFSEEDSLGLTMGVTGDFQINPRFSVVVELSGHYADFDRAQIFLLGHAGVVFRF